MDVRNDWRRLENQLCFGCQDTCNSGLCAFKEAVLLLSILQNQTGIESKLSMRVLEVSIS